jgi:hypothetical protein
MDKLDRLLNEFVEAWNAGRRPEVDDFVERAPEAERDELAGLIGAFLEIAPTPSYSPEQLDALRADPTVQAIARVAEDEPGPTPLPRLRERAKLKRDQVVDALARALGFPDKQAKISRYYHQLEIGTITPGQVSQRVVDALADILRVTPKDVEQAGAFFHLSPEPAAEMFLRHDEFGNEIVTTERLEAAAARAPVPEESWDEVDRLFLGGR